MFQKPKVSEFPDRIQIVAYTNFKLGFIQKHVIIKEVSD